MTNETLQFIPILMSSLMLSLGIVPLVRQLAMRIGVVDRPTLARKTHKVAMPMMGGFVIVIALIITTLIFSPASILRELLFILAGAMLLSVVGLLDDRYNLSWRLRFGVQFLAAGFVVAAGIYATPTDIALIDIPLTLIFIVALTNSINFLDNMDGLSSGISTIAAAYFLWIAVQSGQILVAVLAAAIVGGTLGFLAHNFAPSNMFMGDMGALTLGYLLATLAIKLVFANQPVSVSWMIPILILAVPIFDITLVFFQRISEGRSPVDAGRDHISHRLRDIGLTTRQALMVIYIACLIFGFLGYEIGELPTPQAALIGGAGVILLIVLYITMWIIRLRYQVNPKSKQDEYHAR